MQSRNTLSTSTLRVSNHNNWPVIERFRCEEEFLERLAQKNVQQIFVTSPLLPNDSDDNFNARVGHILDCLDSLPMRPDAAFDSLYRIIDQGLDTFARHGTPRARSFVHALFAKDQSAWTTVTERLLDNIPQQSADYAASRMLDCFVKANPPHTEKMKQRASRSLGRQRFTELQQKFLVNDPLCPNVLKLPYENRRSAGRLMRLIFRQRTPLPQKISPAPAGFQTLDLTNPTNLLSASSKLESLIEICLTTYRHERFHGEAFSPFRSSKASLKTYAHAYYMLLCSYILVLGLMELDGQGGVSISAIDSISKKMMDLFSSFFEASLDK